MQLHDPGRHNWVFWNSYAGVLHRIDTSLTCMRGDNGVQLHLHNGKNVALGDIRHFRALWPQKVYVCQSSIRALSVLGGQKLVTVRVGYLEGKIFRASDVIAPMHEN